MSQITHTFFSSVLSETHDPEIQQHLELLQVIYLNDEQTKAIISQDIDEIDDVNEIDDADEIDDANEIDDVDDTNITPRITDDITNETIFTPEQINKFRQIYLKKIIEDDDEYDNEEQNNKKILDKLDEDAQKQKLKTIECCQEKCLQKINEDDAIIRFQNYNKLSYNEKNIFLKGVLASTLRSNVTTKGEKRQKLATEYFFEGVKICKTAFLTIYSIGDKKWERARKSYTNEDIQLSKHKLIGRTINHEVYFETILNILTFIMNYANIHGLPSPG
jgi:hypothetical protein